MSRKILILCQGHRTHNVDGPKLPGGGVEKLENCNRKTNYSVSKLQRNTSIRNNKIQKSGMILHIYSGTSFIAEPEARSRTGGYFFLGPKSKTPIQEMLPENGPVHVE